MNPLTRQLIKKEKCGGREGKVTEKGDSDIYMSSEEKILFYKITL